MDTPYKKFLKISNQNDLNNLIEYFKETSYISPLSFDVFTQNHEDYISEFNQKRNEIDKLTLQYELRYYRWLKDVADYVFNGIDFKNPPPPKAYITDIEIEAQLLENQNPKKVYDNCFWIVDFLERQKNEIITPQKTKKPKPELKLNDFFIKGISNNTIEAIQTEFKELRGKDLAILIYLLHREYKIIEIITNSNTKGRKSFVKCLTETDNPPMQGVNKCFEPNTDNLIYSKDDLDFQSLNKRLTKIMEKAVV